MTDHTIIDPQSPEVAPRSDDAIPVQRGQTGRRITFGGILAAIRVAFITPGTSLFDVRRRTNEDGSLTNVVEFVGNRADGSKVVLDSFSLTPVSEDGGDATLENLRFRFKGTQGADRFVMEAYDGADSTEATIASLDFSSIAGSGGGSFEGATIDDVNDITLGDSPNFTLSIPIILQNGTRTTKRVNLGPIISGLTGGGGVTEPKVNELIAAALANLDIVDQTARDTANNAFNGATLGPVSGGVQRLTLTRAVGDDVDLDIEVGEGGTESEDDFTGAELTDNVVTLTRRSATNPVELDLSDYVNRTAEEIATELFTTSSRDFTPEGRETYNIPAGGIRLGDLNLGAITGAEATAANNGETVRVTVAPLWTETSESGFPAQVTATILLNRPGRNPATIQESSVHLRGSQTASVAFNLPTSGNQAGDTLQVNFAGQDNGNGSQGTIEIASATISVQGTGTAPVIALAKTAANEVVSQLRNDVAAVETRSFNNQAKNTEQDTSITANTTKNEEQDREITALQQRTGFTPSEAALDLLRRALEVHMDGDPTYTGRIRSVVRWQVGATPPTTLDNEGVTVGTPQRRTISGLGTQNDKIYYVKTNSFNSDAGGHLIYRVTASGGDEPIFGTVVNSAGTRVWQAISTDPLDPNIFQIITTATLTAGIPYQTGDTIGWAFETFENGHARVVPVIIRADGTTNIQGNDVNFNSDNAATNFDPDKIAIVTGNHISDVWAAKLDGLGARHSEIAAADPREAGLGFRVAGAGRDILTLSGDIEWTGNRFIVKEGALQIRKADGTLEVFTAGGEIPTSTINAAISAYLADNPISPTQATVVQRNYDATVLGTAAAASLGGDTGLWVIASDQTGTQGIPVANVSAPTNITLPDAVNGIVNLPGGTLCRIFSGTNIRVVFLPGESAQTGLEIVALLAALSGDERLAASAIKGLATVATSGSYNDLTDTPTITNGVDGQDGRTRLRIYQVTARGTTPNAPSGGAYNNYNLTLIPPPWTVNIPEVDTATQDLWVTEATGNPNSGTVSPWSTPRRFSGRDGVAGNLADLEDVVITDPKTDDVLVRDENGNWVNGSPPGGGGSADGSPVSVIEELTYTLDPVQTAMAAYQNVGLVLPAGESFVDGSNLYFDIQRNGSSRQRGGVEVALADLRAATSAAPLLLIRVSSPTFAYAYMDANNNIFWQTRDGTGTNPIDDAEVTLPTIRYSVNRTVQLTLADNLDETGIESIAPVRVIKQGIEAAILAAPDTYYIDAWVGIDAGQSLPSDFAFFNSGADTWDNTTGQFTLKPRLGTVLTSAPTNGLVFDVSDLPADAATSTTRDYYHFVRRYRVGEIADSIRTWLPLGKWGDGVGGGGGTDTNSYVIDAWIRVPNSVTAVAATALTSAGTWNDSAANPAFTTKPTTNVAGGTVFDISDLPASASVSDTFNYHRFQRIFTIGESGVAASAWNYLGQSNHPVASGGSTRRYLIHAYLRIQAGDVPTATALTSGGIWSDQSQAFTTKPTENVLDGMVYDDSDLPSDAATSTQYDYWEYVRYWTEGEGTIAGTAWRRIKKIDQDPATGGGASLAWTALTITAGSAPITLSSTQLTGMSELAVAYGTSTTIGGGTDDHGSGGEGNASKVWGTNIALAIIPPYNATNAFMQFGGFGRGAQQYVVQVKRTDTGGLLIEAIDSNDGTNDNILSIHAR